MLLQISAGRGPYLLKINKPTVLRFQKSGVTSTNPRCTNDALGAFTEIAPNRRS